MEAFEILFPILSLPPNSPKFSKGLRYVHTLSPRVGISLRRVCQTNLERTNSLNFGLEEDHKEVEQKSTIEGLPKCLNLFPRWKNIQVNWISLIVQPCAVKKMNVALQFVFSAVVNIYICNIHSV